MNRESEDMQQTNDPVGLEKKSGDGEKVSGKKVGKKTGKKRRKKIGEKFEGKVVLRVPFGIFALLAIAVLAMLFLAVRSKKSKPSIISTSTLEKIINVSDLSTFEAIYNGVAKVPNPEDSEKINYYVSYDAKVKAGIDFEKVDIAVDNEEKTIAVKLPEIKITDITVDIESLDYIFINANANTSTVSEEAYKQCIEDVTQECDSENVIYELAEQNAKNVVEALIRPFVSSLDSEYQLQID